MKLRTALLGILLATLVACSPISAQDHEPSEGSSSASQVPTAKKNNVNTRLFQVVMVKANGAGEQSTADLPKSAQAALADLGDFLPYKNYILMDTALLRTARHATTRLKNDDGGEYVISLGFRMTEDAGQEIFVHHFKVVYHTADGSRVTERTPAGHGKAGTVKFAPRVIAPKTFIDTSFGMKAGETLVVGSSRLNGSKTALIFLVTAVP